ncbi:MAG: TlyA family RNA methyltransferase [Thermomicrobiales bacterium]|nr:TlyA family RNA methyltransferase [Thermomicrobiales bacterium]
MSGAAERLDIALVDRGIAETRSKAQALILAGDVRVDGQTVARAGQRITPEQLVTLKERRRFVSRGGNKLQHALDHFGIEPAGFICADIGASTGGFTDCLLQAGAARVYAIDVGYGQLDYRLREDPRVVVMERSNARYLEALPEPIDLTTIDVSFISLRLIFPVVATILGPSGQCVALVKPQFEAGKNEIGKKGVVSDPTIHRRVLSDAANWAVENGLSPVGVTRSPLLGPEGNREFLLYLSRESNTELDLEAAITEALNAT